LSRGKKDGNKARRGGEKKPLTTHRKMDRGRSTDVKEKAWRKNLTGLGTPEGKRPERLIGGKKKTYPRTDAAKKRRLLSLTTLKEDFPDFPLAGNDEAGAVVGGVGKKRKNFQNLCVGKKPSLRMPFGVQEKKQKRKSRVIRSGMCRTDSAQRKEKDQCFVIFKGPHCRI